MPSLCQARKTDSEEVNEQSKIAREPLATIVSLGRVVNPAIVKVE